MLVTITGYAAVSLQPNAGSQGELAGLLAIRGYHAARGESSAGHLPHSGLGPRHQRGQRGQWPGNGGWVVVDCDDNGNRGTWTT